MLVKRDRARKEVNRQQIGHARSSTHMLVRRDRARKRGQQT